jgi:hypothetical protein
MRPLPKLSHTLVSNVEHWANFHHTIVDRAVPLYLTPGASGISTPSQGAALTPDLNAILGYCFEDPPERLCVIGSRWSLSNILDPANVLLDAGAWNQIVKVDPKWITTGYPKARGGVPVIVQGAATIATLNRVLGAAGLALQTSGAGDGHRIAGCIATGTHGSHLKVGAVHDTVLAMLLVTGPDHGALIQPSSRRFKPELTQWFRDQTTLTVIDDVADDELFAAAQVSLGGLGFVHSVIVEAVPLYEWVGLSVARSLFDEDIWNAMETLDTTALGSTSSPDFLSIVFSPFAQTGDNGSFATWMCTQPASRPYAAPGPVQTRIASDLSQLLSRLVPLVDLSGLDAAFIGQIIAAQTSAQYHGGPVGPKFPGSVFGPTSMPEGNGRSVEVVVDHVNTRHATQIVIETLRQEGHAGRHLLGGASVRFAPRSSALLGMNIHAMNAYIEFPCLGSSDTDAIHRAVFDALRGAGILFTCHWGQEYEGGMDAASVRAYFGDRVDRWKAARRVLLPSAAARAVFTNPLIERMGLS